MRPVGGCAWCLAYESPVITFYLDHLTPMLLAGHGRSLVSLPVDWWYRSGMLGMLSMWAVAGGVGGSCCKEVVRARQSRVEELDTHFLRPFRECTNLVSSPPFLFLLTEM